MKFEGNKKLALTLVMLGVIISFFGGTVAYWSWETSEEEKTLVSVEVQGATLTIVGGNVEKTGMYPTPYCDGEAALIGEIATVTAVNGTESDMEAIIRIRATLSVSQGTLTTDKKSKIKWALVDTSTSSTCSNTPYKGTLADASTNTDIDTGIRFTATAESTITKTYKIYVWLDSTYTHTNSGNDITDPMQNINISVKFSEASELSQEFNPAPPVLDEGMIPVTIANDGTVKTISASSDDWYDYSNQEWANVVLVNSASRSNYQGTTGKTITSSDILAYYVWIPRYKYRITNKCSAIINLSTEDNPECYEAPYTMSDTDKSSLITWWQEYYVTNMGDESFTTEQATSDIDGMLQTGYLMMTVGETTDSIHIAEFVSAYNLETSSNATYTGTLNGNNTTSGPNTIDIVFETKDAAKSTGDAVNTYYTHPAFAWDGNNVGGIWVGKFETGHTTLSSSTTLNNLGCTDENCTNADGLIIKPNVVSLRYNNISNQFYASRSMSRSGNPFGFNSSTTDSHMMKNSEWGAVAYLSHSKYGINYEIRINNNSNYTTGCGASEENGSSTSTCEIAYGSGVTSYPQSTTGNITGIFDMSGGAWEYVMGVYSGANSNYDSDTSYFGWTSSANEAGFTSQIESKYWDEYTTDNVLTTCNGGVCFGHALSETKRWYSDDYYFIGASYPWFKRGAGFGYNRLAGVWVFYRDDGGAGSNGYGVRYVAIVN